jgi:thioredoxin 1
MKRLPFILALAFLAGLPSCGKIREIAGKRSAPAEPHTGGLVSQIGEDKYDDFRQQPGRVILIDFYADWCGPCRALSPVLHKIADENDGLVLVGKVDVDQSRSLAAREGVKGIPDVRIFRDGKQVDRLVGFPGEAEVRRRIGKQLEGLPPLPPEAAEPAETESSGPVAQPMSEDWMPPGMQRR